MQSYIKPVCFRAELAPRALMDFIGRTPSDVYCLTPAGGYVYYGIVISDDILEFLTNEFQVRNLEIVNSAEITKLSTKPGCKIWGNVDLIDY